MGFRYVLFISKVIGHYRTFKQFFSQSCGAKEIVFSYLAKAFSFLRSFRMWYRCYFFFLNFIGTFMVVPVLLLWSIITHYVYVFRFTCPFAPFAKFLFISQLYRGECPVGRWFCNNSWGNVSFILQMACFLWKYHE